MKQIYLNHLKKKVTADIYNGNVRWTREGSRESKIEPKSKFYERVERLKWELIEEIK